MFGVMDPRVKRNLESVPLQPKGMRPPPPPPPPRQARTLFGARRQMPRLDNANQAQPTPLAVEEMAAAPSNGIIALPPPGREAINLDGSPVAQAAGQAPQPAMAQQGAPQGPLGGSMRQPFDYDAAREALLGNQKGPKAWQIALAAVGDGLVAHNGGTPWATRSLAQQRNDQQQRLQDAAAQLAEWRYKDFARQNEADLGAAAPFTLGNDRVVYDPATGQAQSIWTAPEEFELYAEELGLQPGTPEYFEAVEDYVLRSSGPSAHVRDLEVDDHRTANDRSLESYRFDNRAALEAIRQANRVGMEGTRQGNRVALRNIPQVRSSSSGGAGTPVKVSSPAEAQKLKPGTVYQTPDGRVMAR